MDQFPPIGSEGDKSVPSQTRLNWIRTGPPDGDMVILIHPVGYDLTHWEPQIEALRETHDVIAFDLPGHGLSDGGPELCTFDDFVLIITHLIEMTGKGRAHIVGISVGGMIAQSFALAHPEMTLSLTLIATASTFAASVREGMRVRADLVRRDGMEAVLETTIQRWFSPVTILERPHLIDRVSKVLLRNSATVHAAMWETISRFEVYERLGDLRCPTLIIAGSLDPSTPPSASSTMAGAISSSQMVTIPETAHMIALEAPHIINAHLLTFLSR